MITNYGLILGGNRRSYTAAQVLEMISGMDSDVALTDDEHENDDADSDSDFETINMNDLRQDHDSSSNSSDSFRFF